VQLGVKSSQVKTGKSSQFKFKFQVQVGANYTAASTHPNRFTLLVAVLTFRTPF